MLVESAPRLRELDYGGSDRDPAREADLVIGADGLHTRVRQLLFGPEVGVEVSQ